VSKQHVLVSLNKANAYLLTPASLCQTFSTYLLTPASPCLEDVFKDDAHATPRALPDFTDIKELGRPEQQVD
jgi:hypothetical protein